MFPQISDSVFEIRRHISIGVSMETSVRPDGSLLWKAQNPAGKVVRKPRSHPKLSTLYILNPKFYRKP